MSIEELFCWGEDALSGWFKSEPIAKPAETDPVFLDDLRANDYVDDFLALSVLRRHDDTDVWVDDLTRALQSAPDHDLAIYSAAVTCHGTEQDFALCAQQDWLSRLEQLDPNNGVAALLRLDHAFQDGDPDEALDHLRQAAQSTYIDVPTPEYLPLLLNALVQRRTFSEFDLGLIGEASGYWSGAKVRYSPPIRGLARTCGLHDLTPERAINDCLAIAEQLLNLAFSRT